jgi:hypothetical protein
MDPSPPLPPLWGGDEAAPPAPDQDVNQALPTLPQDVAAPEAGAAKPVNWHLCGVDGCDAKAKFASHIKQHRADKHNLDVVWHDCASPAKTNPPCLRLTPPNPPPLSTGDQVNCDYKAKTAGHIKRHKAYKHDLDVQ